MILVRFTLIFLVILLVAWIYTGRMSEIVEPVDTHVCTDTVGACSLEWKDWRIVE